MSQKVELANRNYGDLAPFFAQRLTSAIDACVADGYLIRLFEGFRSVERQRWLYASGRTRLGSIVTHAKGGQSWHQYGTACDVVGYSSGHWDWSIDYDKIDAIFKDHGFESLKFERAHKQIRGGLTIAQAQRIVAADGIEALWSKLENYK